MANEGQLPFTGNLTADPELRYTPDGTAVCNFTVAVTPKVWDKREGKHVDGQTVFWPCTVWRDFALNVAATFTKGMRVTGLGLVKEDSFEDKQNNKRYVKKLDIESVGPDLRFAQAQVRRGEGGQSGGQSREQAPAFRSAPMQNQDQSGGGWPTTQPGSGGGGGFDSWPN